MAEIKTEKGNYILLKILKRSEYENKHKKKILYGFVAKVKSKNDNRIYAMKRIDLSLVENQDKKKYYENELKIIELKNENVYMPIYAFKEKNVIYIITEYIDGQNLSDLFEWHKKNNRRKIDEKRIEKIFDQCLRSLNYIHKKGIIHRSIKLDNIVIDSNDRVKIINFKYAIEKNNNDNAKVNIGIFTAPEIKEGNYDEKVDVYSLGIVFNLLMYFSNKSPEDKDGYSDYLYQIIKNMIIVNKTNRLSSEKIYLKFKNNYYNLMRACLKCFVFLLQDEIIKLEISGLQKYEKIIELAKKIKNQEPTNIDELAKEFEEDFFENGFSLNDISPINFTYYILSKFRNQVLLKDISYELKIFEQCPACQNKTDSKENHYIVHFNVKQIQKANGNIKDIFKNFNENKVINSFYEKCTKQKQMKVKMEKTKECKIEKKMEKTTKYFNLPKFLIILIENGYVFQESNVETLNNFELGKKEGFDNKYWYQLNSIITKQNENYDYYNRYNFEFTKKEDLSKTYSLEDICKQDIIGLYYYQTNKILNTKPKNINIENRDQSSTRASSAFNGNESQKNNQNIQVNNGVFMNNFLNGQGNNNSNSTQINNFIINNNANNNLQFNNQHAQVQNLLNNMNNLNNNNNFLNNLNNNMNNNGGQVPQSKNIHKNEKSRK